LENNAKDQLRATAPHIGFIGHITPEDLHSALAQEDGDRTGGFYNRFILLPAKRVRTLPFGGKPPACDGIVAQVRDALKALGPPVPASDPITLEWADDAMTAWESFYIAAKSAHPFLSGLDGFHDRLAPQVMRVAMLFAVIDGSPEIHRQHLVAAKALCLHALDASRDLLAECDRGHERPGRLVDRVRAAMKSADGDFTKTDVWNRIGRHAKSVALDTAIDMLVSEGSWLRISVNCSAHQARPRYRVATDDPPPEDDPPQKSEDGLDAVIIDGHPIAIGKPFDTPRPIDALDTNDCAIGLPAGSRVRLVQHSPHATAADRAWLGNLVNRKPHHRLTLVGENCLRFLPRKPCLEWASDSSST
jgi:hypothetical protein